MAHGVLVFIEERQGTIKKPSLEALSAARKLADALQEEVTAVYLGAESTSVDLAHYGADRVSWARHDLLAAYSPEAYTAAVAQAAESVQPRILLAAATSLGRDFLPRVAARLQAGLAQDCVEARLVEQNQLECVRPIYAGKALARVRFSGAPALATLRPNVFRVADPATDRSAEVVEFRPEMPAEKVRSRATGLSGTGGQKVELTEADIIVSGGRGLKGPENFPLVQELADALGGALGASRAAVDAGWIDHQHQVGQTGKTVSPTLYIACGISGAIQHLAGMSSSKCVVAVNKDPEAPIFQVADYGIVGDLFEVVPALIQAVKQLKAQ
ncbi:MAG: electron transfer flavoprotein subunit alpha/FixB family protein [Acidobacteria bacterium]|nr:electron transfer flavoprotein subunit alpha/FixB family protein [Acidobacteriota bacterium]